VKAHESFVHALYSRFDHAPVCFCDLWNMSIPAGAERQLREVRERAITCFACILIAQTYETGIKRVGVEQ
jgi:hypothetical protein